MMNSNSTFWRRLPIVELCEAHVDCLNRTAPVVSEVTPFKMLRTTNVRNGYIDVENVRYVTAETYKKWTRRLVPRRNDIILTREAPLGDVGKIRTDDRVFLGQRLYHFRPDPQKLDADFLLYSLLGDDLQGQIKGFGSGATVEHMRLQDIPSLEVNVPPLPVQKRIAGILSAYDELIENCQRRIKILETMARALYREWFVHFRFPGYENYPPVASSLGEIPQGWEVKTLPECVKINPRVAIPREGVKPFVPMSCLSNDSMLVTDFETREGNSGSKFQNGDTLFARITPCLENGKTGFVQFLPDSKAVAFGSTEFIVLRSRTLTPELVYLLARSDEFRNVAIKSMTGASGRQRVQEQCFHEYLVMQPPDALLDHFSAIVAPSFRLIHRLQLQIQNLRSTRDLLLPRLLSGQVELREQVTA
ncbi:restriction endonuclease subunit S [Methylococcus mesophilus]|uniref:restriction endonuclease subunit S n=1 Tax=Methylococcus mesophilus TaxID=2993564 RepID=UPI00224AA6E8|nr:restriction endonuclease subunit S [Methylococcus mesophilus]UZR27864.1 restriction endonuclease subunit S [Methylococcus mesophilus]